MAGLGVSGFAAADALPTRGARHGVDGATPEPIALGERAHILDILDVDVRLGAEHVDGLPADGYRAGRHLAGVAPRPAPARGGGRGRHPGLGRGRAGLADAPRVGAAPWLTVTGTNGKTTTVNMLASILRAAGLRATSAGNVGTPILEAVLHPEPYDVIAVELSSFQLHWQRSVAPRRLGLPQRRARPRRLARLPRGVPAGQGPGLPEHRDRLRLQRRRTR